MKVAAIYDIHGNLPALEAVLEDIRGANVDYIVVGGDVLPGPMPTETLACLRELDIPVSYIQGNGDREVLALLAGTETGTVPEPFRAAMRWVAEQLEPSDVHELASWPPTTQLPIAPLGNVLFCHATPRSDMEIFTRLTPVETLMPLFDGLGADVVVCGHTHMQFDRMVGRVRVVNAGSVGMPFQEPGAYWLLLDRDIQLRRTTYDLTSAAALVRATAYPQAESFATTNVLTPPSEEEMLGVFTRVQLT
jgi:predicted phosphodiesterase